MSLAGRGGEALAAEALGDRERVGARVLQDSSAYVVQGEMRLGRYATIMLFV